MQIVINNVSEEEYKDFCDRYIGSHNPVINAMCNGTPLPKGHGELVDISPYKGKVICSHLYSGVKKLIEVDSIEPIIEADKPQKKADIPCEENDSGYNCENWIP